MYIPKEVEHVLCLLNEKHFEAFLVGGCVRNHFLNLPVSDYDVATSARPEEIQAIFDHTVETGILHGTVTVIIEKTHIEVTTYRIDGKYENHRRPDEVVFTQNLERDLERRDFTMNAIAYSLTSGFIDPYDGIVDIGRKIITAVGDATVRFAEDSLRMLRALRFAAELEFSIERKTLLAIKKNAELISYVSKERVKIELDKLILSVDPSREIKLLCELGLLSPLGLAFLEKSDIDQVSSEIFHNPLFHLGERYALIFSELTEQELKTCLKILKFDNKTAEMILLYYKGFEYTFRYDSYSIKRALNHFGEEGFFKVLNLQRIKKITSRSSYAKICEAAQGILARDECIFIKDLLIDGQDLIEFGAKEGEIIGACLEFLLDEVLKNDKLNNKNDLILLARIFLENNS